MKEQSLYNVVYSDGTESHGLTYKEAEEAMRQAELTDNTWVRVYCEARDYKHP